MDSSHAAIWVWRHPRPSGIDGYCIGRTDVAVDPRRAKRLARRIDRVARQHGLPRTVWTSPLRRCADVGRWLKRWGWVHHVDSVLLEMDFGSWDGRPWAAISEREVEAWSRDFVGYAPGAGETLVDVLARAALWRVPLPAVVVGHAGWMRARRWIESSAALPASAQAFSASPAYGALWRVGLPLRAT